MLGQSELEIAARLPGENCPLAEAESYTRRLATRHYENFRVVSWLLPARLHQHFYNVYAYCRWSDDLGDEVPDGRRALALLDAWDEELQRAYDGKASHPVLIALAHTTREFEIPIKPFQDLLIAFRQDQRIHRYETWSDVLRYCEYSANPVGRLVLYLFGYSDEERQKMSDATCTALQLANFWQDVGRDLEKGRIYIPLEIARAHGVTENDIVSRRFSANFAELMKELLARTRALFAAGEPLAQRVSPEFRVDVELFSRGGRTILDAIERMGYDTLHWRPAISRAAQVRLLFRALMGRFAGGWRSGPNGSRRRGETEPASVATRHV